MARYGVWSYHHGDNLVNRGGPNSFWEVMQGDPVTGSVLQILTEDLDNGKVIYRSYSATNRYSLSLSRNAHYWKSAAFIQRRLRDLYEFGPSTLDQDPYAAQYTPYSGRLNRRPTNLESIPLLARFGARQLAHIARRVAHQTRWQIAYGLSRESECLASSFFRFKRLQAPRGRSWSEPFPVAFGEKYFVFLTEQIHETGASHIVVLELDGQGFGSGSSVVLETAGGLSYPFIFEWAGHFYLIPNQPSQQHVALYRCTSFPGVWELDRVLLHDVNAANATLTELDRSWWMFVNMAVEGASLNDELHLYRAESPLGPWEPHRGNPIKSDVRSSRPGGRVFNWNGEYYRPAQDCSLREGYAISINRIVDLSPTSYREVETSKILPKWSPGLIANKTINHWGRLTCLDAAVRKTRLSAQ
jgi:hypothetical protein